jgi:transcriptional regulator with XRE-family HTH domain
MMLEAEIGTDTSRPDFSEETSTFGDRLVHAREALGLDQAQLAHRLGIKAQTLRNWEEDRSEPRANKLQMLAGLLNVSMIWLLAGQGMAPQASDAPSDFAGESCLADLRRLRADQIHLVEKMARLEKRLRAVLS